VDKIGKLLPGVLARQRNQRQIGELRIRLAFRDLLGPDLAAACSVVELRRGTLTVATDNPALAHQLRLDASHLVARLNGLALRRQVRELRVRTGRPKRQSL
jgi:hypothetical protein